MSSSRGEVITLGDSTSPKIIHRVDNHHDIPEGAIIVSEDEALEAQFKLLERWHPKEEIWPFIHGQKLLAGVTCLTGFFANGHIRSFFHLTHQKMLTTLIPSIAIPYLMTQIYHSSHISNQVLLGNTKCPACMSSRSGAGQSVLSSLVSLTVTTFSSYAVANLERTHPLPTPWDYRGIGKLCMQLMKANRRFILGSLTVNFLFGYWLAHKEMKSYIIMQLRLKHNENVFLANTQLQNNETNDSDSK